MMPQPFATAGAVLNLSKRVDDWEQLHVSRIAYAMPQQE
jgi:hypothetical protein